MSKSYRPAVESLETREVFATTPLALLQGLDQPSLSPVAETSQPLVATTLGRGVAAGDVNRDASSVAGLLAKPSNVEAFIAGATEVAAKDIIFTRAESHPQGIIAVLIGL